MCVFVRMYMCVSRLYYVLAVVSVYVCTKSGSLSRHMQHHVMYACVYGGSRVYVYVYTHVSPTICCLLCRMINCSGTVLAAVSV